MRVIGWDIGGAHIKAALADNGCLKHIVHQPCPIGNDWPKAQTIIIAITKTYGNIDRHIITMTAEMGDCFASRKIGVLGIVRMLSAIWGAKVRFYAGEHGLVTADQCCRLWRDIASANWHASARFIAAITTMDAILVDIGSTTTDIIPFGTKNIAMSSDFSRLADGRLLYSGVIRTPVTMISPRLNWKSKTINLIPEYFADMGDVYRILGQINPKYDLGLTADGRPKDLQHCRQRLARLIGRDYKPIDQLPLQRMVDNIVRQHKKILHQTICRHARDWCKNNPPLIAAGIGAFLLRDMGQKHGLKINDYGNYVRKNYPSTPSIFDINAAAAAVALTLGHDILS